MNAQLYGEFIDSIEVLRDLESKFSYEEIFDSNLIHSA